jgi:hypothetical protein
MKELLAFWNRSKLNKAIVIIVLLIPCGLLNMITGGTGGDEAALAPTAEAPTSVLSAEPTSVSATDVPTAEPTSVPAYQSGGLGLSREAWEARYGTPTDETVESTGVYFYQNNSSVMYMGGHAWHINHNINDTGIPVEDAREITRQFLPEDAAFIETYTNENGQLVDLYHSPSLVSQFPDDNWPNGSPGDHIVIYRQIEDTGQVFSIVIGTGNNP